MTRSLLQRVLRLPRPLLIGLDVDGTLAPIVERPEQARVPTATVRTLRALRDREGVDVALVTGRDKVSLARVIRLGRCFRALEHGRYVLDRAGRGAPPAVSDAAQRALTRFSRWARQHSPPGVRSEHKRASVAVHTRTLSHDNPTRARMFERQAVAAAKALGLHARQGRAVVEAEAHPGNKGAALQRIVALSGARSVIYAGDDLTDLPALRVAVEQRGIGVFVRSPERKPPRFATASLNGPAELAELLTALDHALERARRPG